MNQNKYYMPFPHNWLAKQCKNPDFKSYKGHYKNLWCSQFIFVFSFSSGEKIENQQYQYVFSAVINPSAKTEIQMTLKLILCIKLESDKNIY